MNHDAASVRRDVEPHRARWLEPFFVNRPENFSPDQRTKDLWCLDRWLDETTASLGDEMRRRAGWHFNRKARGLEDVWALAADTANQAAAGTLPDYRGR